MKCQYCNNEVPANVSTCPSCGAQVVQGQPAGAPAATPNMVCDERKSRVCYQLLALFLGGLGIHNFYAGYTAKAVIQLLICLFLGWLGFPLLIVGVWCLVEIFSVKKDARGIPMT